MHGIDIEFPEGDDVRLVRGTKISVDGVELLVSRLEMDLDADSLLQAKVTVEIDQIKNTNDFDVVFSENVLFDLARHYGYGLVEVRTDGKENKG